MSKEFDEFMESVKALPDYPELEGTTNLCEDILKKKTGKMTEEEWQAAERTQTSKMYSEEEVKSILMKTDRFLRADLDIWFEQFKKK